MESSKPMAAIRSRNGDGSNEIKGSMINRGKAKEW